MFQTQAVRTDMRNVYCCGARYTAWNRFCSTLISLSALFVLRMAEKSGYRIKRAKCLLTQQHL